MPRRKTPVRPKKTSVKRRQTKPRPISLPRTASARPSPAPRPRASRARSNMSLTELQFMAKSMGIPFGGLPRAQLVHKINNYS